MAGGAREGWRADPYRRHELRYWDGLAWTAHVSDMGVVGDDPVFPVLDSDAHSYLAPTRPRRRRRLPGLDRAAAWAVSGFLGVIALATFAAVDGGVAPAHLPPQVAEVEAAAAQVPSAGDRSRSATRAVPIASAPAATAPNPSVSTPARTLRTTALAALTTLPVRPTITRRTADDDERLRTAQPDPHGTACDARQEVLRRDLTRVVLAADRCTVRSGVLRDPYSGITVQYRPGPAAPAVQIDHAVAMPAAWRTGAALLGDEQLRAIANDPLNLLALSSDGRRARGSSDAAGWLPRDRQARCAYVARQIAVKVAYGLWVTGDERAAMREVLTACPQEPLPAR